MCSAYTGSVLGCEPTARFLAPLLPRFLGPLVTADPNELRVILRYGRQQSATHSTLSRRLCRWLGISLSKQSYKPGASACCTGVLRRTGTIQKKIKEDHQYSVYFFPMTADTDY
jgi:hypothetical protein